MEHPTDIDGLTPEQLASRIGDMRYDALARFLRALEAKLALDAVADRGRGREVLARRLELASTDCGLAATNIGIAWRICERFMTGRK
jgi:hypothetical protein